MMLSRLLQSFGYSVVETTRVWLNKETPKQKIPKHHRYEKKIAKLQKLQKQNLPNNERVIWMNEHINM